jgi:hypothetical protein
MPTAQATHATPFHSLVFRTSALTIAWMAQKPLSIAAAAYVQPAD